MCFLKIVYVVFLLLYTAECRKKGKLQPMKYEVDVQKHGGLDLLSGLRVGTNVSKQSKHVWNFGMASQPKMSSQATQKIVNALTDSLSISVQTKQSRRSKVPILCITSKDVNNNTISWLQLAINQRKSVVYLQLLNKRLQTQELKWHPKKKITKKWFNFMMHVDGKTSTVGVTDGNGVNYGAILQKGINLQLPSDIEVLVGGSFTPSFPSFVGQMKQLEIYTPSRANFSNVGSSYKTMGTILRKRGAARKPDSAHQTNLHSSVINQIKPNNTITALPAQSIATNQDSTTLENAVHMCQSEVTTMKETISSLQQSLNQIQQRVTLLESCECTRRCQGSDGRYHSNDATWSENECLTCTCVEGMVSCERLPSCGNLGVCDTSPCKNQGICEETNNGFLCQCQNGFHGSLCEHVDHCQTTICQNGGRCTSSNSQYRCDCLTGYSGRHCEMVDWCAQRPCENGGMCTNGDQGHECQCHLGFTGENCQHQDFCLPSPCENNGRCKSVINHNGNTFQCLCQDGFVGDRCEMVDSCADEPCMNGAVCTNTLDGFLCGCEQHYTGRLCETYDVCHSLPCLNGGQCEPAAAINGHDYQCICPQTHSGVMCELPNHCSSNPCMHNGVCTNLETSFSCRCPGTHFGKRCQHLNYCRGDPCLNEGNCVNSPLDQQQPFKCICPDGYTGSLCENKDFCASSPCLNDGICSVTDRSYSCQCLEQYLGQRCEVINYCTRNPCLHGGVCKNLANGFKCLCLPSHHGRRCEVLHPCRNNPCLNGGICTSERVGIYTCECPPTHYGRECQMINRCYDNPCLNRGTCIQVKEEFVCQCAEGFYGETCSLTNQCTSTSCLNGGTCTNVNGSIACSCPSTHRGPRCQFVCNVCMYSANPGKRCNEDSNTPTTEIQRWYYNKESQTCQQFTFQGCGGNANNFNSRQSCRQRCVFGACCLARTSSNTSETMCRRKSINQCKRIHVERSGEFQVTGFLNGEGCSRLTCGPTETCMFGGAEYEVGSSIPVGCERECSCQADGILSCSCSSVSIRKEVRQLTTLELKEFHSAVRSLKMTELEGGGNVWDILRDEYAQKSPIGQSVKHFLLWNRAFLKRTEMLLQKSHCDVTIPYFDFTLDAGNFAESVLWQPTYFGGDGTCVPDHPFRVFHGTTATRWEPCLMRHFNSSVSIPNIVDVAMAMSSRNFDQLSRRLLSIVSYVKSFIGGDISTTSCAYDPVFYPIHAFIDHLYMQWQNKIGDTGPSFNVPFGFSNEFLKSGACVSYTQSGISIPCNRSNSSPSQFGEDGYNLHGFNADGFDRRGYDQDGFDVMGRDRYGRQDNRHIYVYNGYNAEGYNRAGYDRRGFNRYGYHNGYNRDGYNTFGFDQHGFDRYGLDSSGFDKNGFNIYGASQSGTIDQSDFYDEETGFSDCCFTRDGFTVSGIDRFGFTAAGFNQAQCNYFFNGPHALFYHQKLWEILSVQPISFLATLPRNCKELQKLPAAYLNNNWIFMSRSSTKLTTQIGSNSTLSKRFCFDLDILMTWCPCLEENYPAICHTNPCHNLHCQLHPTAKCHVNVCGNTCSAEFYSDGRLVNCDDPCTSNPCLNGGTCYPSPYSSASERFSCNCPPEYVGSLCEQQTADTCSLPKITGDCTGNVVRWYYSYQSGSCEAFHFSGCGGNANNFPNKQACQLRCSFGACCYKKISNTSQLIGFDPHGFDKYGFNAQGYNRAGQKRSPHNSMPYGNQILGHKGFGPDGYNIHGYDEHGYDRQGYDKDGYHKVTGYNRMGYNRQREYDQLTGYDINGYDSNGLDRSGYGCNGLDRYGYNRLGYYADYAYECRSMSLEECDSVSEPYEVVAFSPGQTCDEVNCGQKCGCEYNGKTYRIGQSINYECQTCKCTLAGTMDCVCKKLGRRKEIRDLTAVELRKYSMAIQKMYLSGEWDYHVSVHSQYMKTSNGATISLPWHRHYLASVERELRKQSDCDVSIPYFDWTMDVGSLNESYVWSVKYFGANGEDETNCVKYHSFGGPDIWHPCIRRDFNMSVSLPDAVDLQILLHEPNYESFRIQLETVAALFHIWVGGHMISPFSPYDPLYLSHWAFMDYLWTDWQMKSPSGMARFPASDRYKLLEPFDVTVDDVLSSQKQICITYLPPTIGSPCNSTTGRPTLTRNVHGFDRHGFDTNGFDVEGFDAMGRDRQGNLDERNIFDHSGYLSSGYKRSGFDSQGWDRFGFTSSDFNRDGIDIEGYDRSGYDQFGFDQNMRSPFGMFRNGTYDSNVDIGHVSTLFDQFGYNKYGYNKHGLDYNGYSAFGYNTQGFDKDRCNFFLFGPHYMRYFYFTIMQLKNLQPNNLLHINRICKPVTLLPKWIAQGWLGDWNSVHNYQNAWARNRLSDTSWVSRSSSVTDEGLWIPVTPDKQFCMDLQWYSGCPLGTPSVECQNDMCEESRCASHPQAQCRTKNCGACYPQFYNGTTGELLMCFGCIDKLDNIYAEGSEWDRNCESCVCHGGMIVCNRRSCPSVPCSHPVLETDQCCESCADCEFEGTIYRNGQGFRHGNCETCHCMHGSVTCKTNNIACPPTPCRNTIKRAGECCPSCPIGCDGHSNGQQWMLDDCHVCNCTNDMIQCSEVSCGRVSCSHPITLQSHCCPTCGGCSFNGRLLENGQQFSVDGCARCTCTMGNVKCISQQCRPLQCQRQTTPPGTCCPVCEEGCEHEGRFYRNGESFHPLESSCRNCTCLNNEVRCHGTACLSVASCPRPNIKENGCCPECSGCSYGENFYRNNQAWTSDDGCESCLCQQGNIACRAISPCQTSCTHGLKTNGQCCSRCSKCVYKTKVLNDGEEFIEKSNLCQKCICKSGNVTCISAQCPTLNCRNQQVVAGECCPQCQFCFHDGAQRSNGESWRLSSNPCTSCSCIDGQVSCETQRCRPIFCENPTTTTGSCCQVCDGCLFNGAQFANGDKASSNVCEDCTCVAGTISCSPKQCPELSCLSQVTVDGECCPSCISCTYEGQQVQEGAEFFSPRNPCLKCVCQMGETQCHRMDSECPSLPCSHPGRVYGECCRKCNMCEYERRNYRNGETFNPPHSSSCLSCTCMDGSVTCSTETCPSISCQNPSIKHGQCCPSCTVCDVDGVSHDSGSVWFPDSCSSCTCNDGVIKCHLNTCPLTNCTHPANVPGYCCPSCHMCSFADRVFTDHQRFSHPQNPCQLCTCKSGSVICTKQRCRRAHCENAFVANGECCPSCPTECVITETLSIRNGETAVHPEDKCMLCSCTNGLSECNRQCLPKKLCSHPTDGMCCRDNCDGCFYRGVHYDNGQSFHHAINPCRMCQCNNGNVRCFRKRCPVPSCSDPQVTEGQCCPGCPETSFRCRHRGHTRENMERFVDGCKICTCSYGEVTCHPKPCPSFSCSNPRLDGCCRRCDGCLINNIEYHNGEELLNHTRTSCESCRCQRGNVICQPITCPPITCSNPIDGECCPQCQGCLYDNVEYDEGSRFRSTSDRCQECVCSGGSVSCQMELCPHTSCTHPVANQGDSCCPACGGSCMFNELLYEDGYIFDDPSNDCRTCVCIKGSVQCNLKQCSDANCRNPVMGICNCSVCGDCMYNGAIRINRETFTNPEDARCSECYCQDGNVVCGNRPCPSSTCTHPTIDICGCPNCDNCLYFDDIYNNNSKFPDAEDTCNTCVCQDGNVECTSEECMHVDCQNPSNDGCGCPLCLSCNYMGIEYNNHEQFIDTMNKCNQCTCSLGTVYCNPINCPSVPCSKPVMPIGECCSRCIGSCLANGVMIENGAEFTSPTNPCSHCSCSFGTLTCVQEQCHASCTHPLPGTDCCPDCSDCLFRGRTFRNGEFFTQDSNDCQQCSCSQGSIICHEMHCPSLLCSNPQPVEGQCCPECPQALSAGCHYNGQMKEPGNQWIVREGDFCKECICSEGGRTRCVTMNCETSCSHPVPVLDHCCPNCDSCFYKNRTYVPGQLFHPDACHDCICSGGNVHCVIKACRPLDCPQNKQAQINGECCPQCISCSLNGNFYADGQKWNVATDHCTSCQCHNGVVTCQPVTCLSACQNTQQSEGQCCPVCEGCHHNHQVYQIGDLFEPNPMNPCEICECIESEDGSPVMFCEHILCPSLVDCPRACIRQPQVGTCCPYCAEECSFVQCNEANWGQQLTPSENRCFGCECNTNDTWICSPQICPHLDCPKFKQYVPKNSCCPVCDKCHLAVENRDVANGETWKVNECTTCLCSTGTITCQEQMCPMEPCGPTRVSYKQAGQCCEECVDPNMGCLYEGHSVASRHQWLVDKCTTCHCFAGKVDCVTKICRVLMCSADEAATVVPGQCCPKCIKKPGSCVAFGDPHFKTFDGRMVTFQGVCKYLLTADCMYGDFRIEVKHTDRGGVFGDVSWIESVFITLFGHKVILNDVYGVSINGTNIPNLPFLLKPYLFIDKSGNHLLVTTQIGVLISWNAHQRYLEVNVPSSYKRKTCGLCGNFNNYPQDDLRLQNSRIATNDIDFGNNWKVNSRNSTLCPAALSYDPCSLLTYSQRKYANRVCKVINSETFSDCHQVVGPEMYFRTCVHDVCACSQNDQFCLCGALEAYAAQCRRSGVVIQWRTTACMIQCRKEHGYVFDECGSPCKRTCANRNLPPDVIAQQCYMPCVSGCQCPAGKVEYQGRCINPYDCPGHIASIELTPQK